ncbi:hypothetical protein [Dermabacter hominis]|uniref:hypothetical protein n=1 Tax=Dermabacter hominis TaxID=36740 RepID=UPI00242CA4D2|nr:hypothetical protein [Dermabacter hominis]
MRIRSIKPEFWRSPDVSNLSIEDRLLYIGLWSYVDDNGVGQDRESVICADLFADDLSRDPRETLARITRGLASLADNGRIVRYTVENRDYLYVTNWDKHQRIDRPNKPRYPLPTSENAEVRDTLATPSRVSHDTLATGTGEQGNRGTGEQGTEKPSVSSSEVADAPSRPEVEHLCTLLADLVEANGAKRPTITKRWRDAARLMIDRDGHSVEQIEWLILWSQRDEFWRANILSMPKFREKFDQLRLKATREHANHRPSLAEQAAAIERFYGEGDAA